MEFIPDLDDDLLEGLISGTSSKFRSQHQTLDFNLLCVHCCWLVVQLPANLKAIGFCETHGTYGTDRESAPVVLSQAGAAALLTPQVGLFLGKAVQRCHPLLQHCHLGRFHRTSYFEYFHLGLVSSFTPLCSFHGSLSPLLHLHTPSSSCDSQGFDLLHLLQNNAVLLCHDDRRAVVELHLGEALLQLVRLSQHSSPVDVGDQPVVALRQVPAIIERDRDRLKLEASKKFIHIKQALGLQERVLKIQFLK